MNTYQSDALRRALENQIRRLEAKIDELNKLSSRISAIRFFDFVLAVILVFLAAQAGSTILFWIILITGLGTFIGLVSWHRRIDGAINRFEGFKKIREQHLARMSLNWDHIPAPPQNKSYDLHPFARDFDLVGQHSLLHLINTTTYSGSFDQLEGWLLNRVPDLPEIKKRQSLVKELKPMAHFRDRLTLYAGLASKKKTENDWSMKELQAWLKGTKQSGFSLPLTILGILSAINITLLVLFLAGIIKPYVIIPFIIYLCAYNYFSEKVTGLFDEAVQIESLLNQFREVLLYLESYPYKDQSALADFCRVFQSGNQKPSIFLKKIIRIAAAACSQSNEFLWGILNMVMPWDMYFAKKLNAFKADLEPRLNTWLDTFYDLEAMNALANYAWLNPSYTFALPKNRKGYPVFEASNLGHPLITKEQKVTNDVHIKNIGDIQLITGSNMAGKSTYLRTIGINLALCFAGGPVNASSFETSVFRLFSSINVTDSLDEGLSHFYAEVKRLRTLLNQLEQPHEHPLFFMVDEIYRGTNNRERLTGSTAFLKHVAGKDGVGLVTTHDLELAQLEDEIPSLSNWHFEETIEDGKMRFEYKLKPGPCPSTNALKIMEMENLPT